MTKAISVESTLMRLLTDEYHVAETSVEEFEEGMSSEIGNMVLKFFERFPINDPNSLRRNLNGCD